MAEVRDVIAARAERSEKLDGGHYGDVWSHGDRHRQGDEPNAPIRKEDRIGHQDSENRSGRADGRNIRQP